VGDIPKAVLIYSEMVKARRKLLEQISKLIEPIDVKRFAPNEISNYKITGADGGANGKELEGFYFGIAGAIACTSTRPSWFTSPKRAKTGETNKLPTKQAASTNAQTAFFIVTITTFSTRTSTSYLKT